MGAFINTGVVSPSKSLLPIFYVYVYWLGNVPFYIGKGHGSRAREQFRPSEYEKRSTLMQRKMYKLINQGHIEDIEVTKFIEGVDEETAFFWEGFLIRAIGRRCDKEGAPLCNLTWGGDRTSTGYKHSKENRAKIRAANIEKWRDPEKRKAIIKSMRNRRRSLKDFVYTEELRQVKQKARENNIKLLRLGSINWRTSKKGWVVCIGETYIGIFRTYVEAEYHRVEACKAYRDGRFDEWIKEVRLQQAKTRASRIYDKGTHKRFKKIARTILVTISKVSKDFIKIHKQNARAKQLEESPWLVDSPYCVFMFLRLGVVCYVGMGRPDRIYRLLRKPNEHSGSPLKKWLQSLDKEPEVRVIYLETKAQAKVWKNVLSSGVTSPYQKVKYSKLNDEQVVEILKLTGSNRSIADRFGVHATTIGAIKRGEAWEHLTSERVRSI